MKKIALLLLVSISSLAQSINFDHFYPIDRGHSYIEFSIKYMGYAKVKGRFADFSGMIYYDEKELSKLSVTLGIKTESIDTDNDFRDKDLMSDNWFDAAQFPLIRFTSKSVKQTTDGFELTGDLTMKNVTKEVVLKMEKPSGVLKDIRQDHQIIFEGTTTLDRTEYGIEGKNWSRVREGIAGVANEVTISFSILGKQLKAGNFSNWVRNKEAPAGKIYSLVKEQSLTKGVEEFKQLKQAGSVDRNVLATVGKMLVLEGNVKDAVTLFELNRNEFPEASEVYVDLGDACGRAGDLKKSKSNIQEAVKLNADNFIAVEMLRHYK